MVIIDSKRPFILSVQIQFTTCIHVFRGHRTRLFWLIKTSSKTTDIYLSSGRTCSYAFRHTGMDFCWSQRQKKWRWPLLKTGLCDQSGWEEFFYVLILFCLLMTFLDANQCTQEEFQTWGNTSKNIIRKHLSNGISKPPATWKHCLSLTNS